MGKNNLRYFNIYYWVRKISLSFLFQKFFFLSDRYKRKVVFNSIYKSFHWRDYNKPKKDESVSGLGSDLNICLDLIKNLNFFIYDNNISSILDLACGDFNWMKQIVNSNKKIKKYCGLEIVDKIVSNNNLKYSNEKVKFIVSDIVSDNLPKNYDLIIIRDFFIHISDGDIMKVLNNIKNTGSKFVAINTFPKVEKNININIFGKHRDINLEKEPFNLRNVFISFADYDRQLNIYKIESLNENS